MLRRLVPGRRSLGFALGSTGLATIDYSLTPKLRPLSTAAAAAGSVGSVQVYQYEVHNLFYFSQPLLSHTRAFSNAIPQICPYCNKIKTLLDLHRVPYETTEVNPLTKKEIKEWSGGYRKVPIAVLAGEQINDSPVIANTLMDSLGTAGVLSKSELATFRSPKALEWAEWSDKQLAVLLFPNITRSFSESYQAFGYVMDVPHFSNLDKWANQLIGSFFMWMAQGKIKKKYNIENEREAVIDGINKWVAEGVGKGPYAGGKTPNFADVCVFGCLKAIDRTDAFKELMESTEVKPWYVRMSERVEPGNACTSKQ